MSDAISRILHDSSLPTNYFTFGYLDRFKGELEKPIAAANWTDALDTIDDVTTFAIPRHRLRFLKCNGELVWHKEDRLDLFWKGGTDPETGSSNNNAAANNATSSSNATANTTFIRVCFQTFK